MIKKQIYGNGSSRLDIEFDGEFFLITQTIYDVEENTISVTLSELEEMLVYARENIQ